MYFPRKPVWIGALALLGVAMSILLLNGFSDGDMLKSRPDVYSWNQRVTLTVITEDGAYTSSTVQRVSWQKVQLGHWNIAATTWKHSFVGSSPFIEMPDGSVILATLEGASRVGLGQALIERTSTRYGQEPAMDEVVSAWADQERNSAIPYLAQPSPQIFGFKDAHDPSRTFLVHPDDEHTQSLGIIAADITIAKTDDPVSTDGLSEVFHWFNEWHQKDQESQRINVFSPDGSIMRVSTTALCRNEQ